MELSEDVVRLLLREREIFMEERKQFLLERQKFCEEKEKASARELAVINLTVRFWYENPLHVWRQVKAAMAENKPLRIADGWLRYSGYLFRVDGNKFLIAKHGKPHRHVSYAQLMGLCLSGELTVDDCRWEMPAWYEKFIAARVKNPG